MSVKLLEYQGKYRIEQGKEKEGKWYADKVRKYNWEPSTKQHLLSDKDGNLSISFGDIDSSISWLEPILADLRHRKAKELNDQRSPSGQDNQRDDIGMDEVPF